MLENWDFISFLLGLFGGIAITIVSVQIRKKSISTTGSGVSVDQSNVKAGGDVVGRDKR